MPQGLGIGSSLRIPSNRLVFQVYKDTKDEWRWRLKAGNGEPIASGEGFASKAACLASIDIVKKSGDAAVEDV